MQFQSSGKLLSPRGQVTSPRIRNQEIEAHITTDVQNVIELINDQEKRNFRLGVIFLIVAIATWIIGLELVNTVLKGDEFIKPWFLAFLTGSCFLLNFIPEICSGVFALFKLPAESSTEFSPDLSASDLVPPSAESNLPLDNSSPEKSSTECDEPIPLTVPEVLSLAFQVSVIYTAYNVFVMMALQYTSASNQTVLGSTTAMFTLFVGLFLNIDRLTSKKLVCVATSLAGVILINVSESHVGENDDNKFKPKNAALGNFFALVGAFCYALYLLTMKLRCGTGKKTTNERQLFGFVGVFTFLMSVPTLAVLDYTGIEKFSLPPTTSVFLMVIINAVFSVISDYVTILAMLLTSPLVTSLALTSSIPITILVDFIILNVNGGKSNSSNSSALLYGFGVLSLLVSVILININITSENELIEEVIEDAFEDAIRHDEILSPVLSPFIGSTNTSGYNPSPRVHEAIGIHRLTPAFLFLKQGRSTSTPLFPTQMNQEDSGFNLNSSSSCHETSSLHNSNHHRKLYTIDASSQNEETEVSPNSNLLVYGGVNHNYYVKTLDSESSNL